MSAAMSAGHTPPPPERLQAGTYGVWVEGEPGVPVFDIRPTFEGDAAKRLASELVRRYNSHAALLAACEAIHAAGIVPFAAEKAETQRGRDNANYADGLLRAALSKARGDSSPQTKGETK